MNRLRASSKRTLALVVKEYKHVWMDPGFLFLTVLSPAVLLTLLAYIFSFDVDHASLVVLNQDRSPASYEYVRVLTADGDISIVGTVEQYDQVPDMMRAGRADGALIIPPGFGDRLNARREAPVNLLVDGSDAGTALQVTTSVEQRTLVYSTEVVGADSAPFDVRLRTWFNDNLRSQVSMIPGLMAVVLILPGMSVALGIAREKETGTFEMLITTPIAGREFLLGKLAVYLSLGLLGTLLALAVATFWFRVPFRGQLLLYLLLTADYLWAVMGFSMFIANFVPSQRTVTSIVLLSLFIPSFFLTGLLVPVDKSTLASEAMAFSMPATHYIIISRGVALKGVTLAELWREAAVLLVMGLLGVGGSIRTFAKKIR